KCGGSLRLIKGKYGKFYGCSNYPRCRYTRNA
ncbi:topoisomerase DNA-binding C4 zinc finger domain-containing protein, partial [Hydrogenivirga sp. 128-5-R1-1]